MSKKDYVDAVNEIKVNEEIKKETIGNIKNVKHKKNYNRIYPIASIALMCAMLLAIIIPSKTVAPIIEQDKPKEIVAQDELPKLGNFNNLYAMLKEKEDLGYGFLDDMVIMDAMESTNSSKQETFGESTTSTDYSKTNVQVEGVDEADIVKTDGKYIYYLTNKKLTITDVTQKNKIVSASNIEFKNRGFYPEEILLKDNKIVVIGTVEREKVLDFEKKYPEYREHTVARVYDIENRENPKLERTVEIEGYYISSRMIDNNIYLLSNKYLYPYLCKHYAIEDLNEEYFKPHYRDTVTENGLETIEFDSIYCIPDFEETSYLNIAAFDITKSEPAQVKSYLGAGSEVYASTTNLYVTKVKYGNYIEWEGSTTEIYKFNLKDATCTFAKTGTVPGTVLNQFSMDEKDGYFRIATTENISWRNEDSTNNLYVLNDNLEIVGKVEGLAPGERIYSVRFMGDRAYMVTFVQTDPLFVIDLKEPTNPVVLGELKIPGYSKYLHPYDDTHLIGIGEDTNIVNYGYGDQVVTDGMKMSLFDVTDPKNPKEMHTVKIGGKGTYSEILYNHKALLFSKEKNILAFPISITEENYNVTFQGAIVYGITLDKGFELRGKISNANEDLDRYYYKNNVERIIYIGDKLYTLSRSSIKATNMNTMENVGYIEF